MEVVARPQTNFTPALIAALLLHLAVLGAGLIAWPWKDEPRLTTGVASITLVDAPPAELRPAVEAPEPLPAMTQAPVPDAPPEAPAPTPAPPAPPPPTKAAPTPTPAAKAPAPAPSPKPAPKAQPKAAAKPASPGLDLDALAKSLTSTAKAGGGRSSAPKGQNRQETAPKSREGKGNADAALADASAVVTARLMRAWNPNCDVEGAGGVVVRVEFNLGPRGELVGQPRVLNAQGGAVWDAAADRAVRAVAQASPFSELPKESYSQWKVFRANFRGDQACR